MKAGGGGSATSPSTNVITCSIFSWFCGSRLGEMELRHSQPLVVLLVLRLLEIVAPRSTQLLPEEAFALFVEQLFREVVDVRVFDVVERELR